MSGGHPTTDDQTYRERLLNVAKALREAPIPEAFHMRWFTHSDRQQQFPCGTPMCALGHYAARTDLQSEFLIDSWGTMQAIDEKGEPHCDRMKAAQIHFGLTDKELEEIFEIHGCGDAQTPMQAAQYIEGFVARKYPEAT